MVFKETKSALKKKYNTIYYGTFRKNREIYFRKYLKKPLYLSSSTKNIVKFKQLNCSSFIIDKLSWNKFNPTLANFKYSLYIEDTETHNNYNHLANRFYEALMYNLIPLFDKSCTNTIKKSGYQIPDEFIVDDLDSICQIEKSDLSESKLAKDWIQYARARAKIEKENCLEKIEKYLLDL